MADSNGLAGASPLASTTKWFTSDCQLSLVAMRVPEELYTLRTGSAEHTGKPKAAERWPQRAKHHALGLGSGNDKATDQNVVTARNEPPRREVERLRPHCRKLRIFQMNRNGVVCSVTAHGRVLIIENLFAGGVQAQELSERGNGRVFHH